MNEVWASKHATKRMRQRLGLTKKAAQREVQRAAGAMGIEDCHGELRNYLEHLLANHGSDAEYRVTPAAVYVFRNAVLVTVLKVPPQLARDAMAAWKRRGRAK
jgi:hypothetical protein